jgi:hypothetical protein
MMVGNNDQQSIREKVSTAAASAAPKINGQQPAKPNPSVSPRFVVRMVAISVFVFKLDDFWIAREWRSGGGGGFDFV